MPAEPPDRPDRPEWPTYRPLHYRRRRLVAFGIGIGIALVFALVAAALGGSGDGGSPAGSQRQPGAGSGRPSSSARSAPGSTSTSSTTTTAPPATTTTGPGTLPQTDTLPSSSTPEFHQQMVDLWDGVVSDDATTALPAFFPEGAYLQLKSIPNPRTDFENRLVDEFRHDLEAAHGLLGGDPQAATLVSVNVPQQYAHWVAPGVCYNSIGYYEVPNSRVVYEVGGAVRSFGIASMISWRGEWYVVHFGQVVRPTTTQEGLVDYPATGPGTSAYSSTC